MMVIYLLGWVKNEAFCLWPSPCDIFVRDETQLFICNFLVWCIFSGPTFCHPTSEQHSRCRWVSRRSRSSWPRSHGTEPVRNRHSHYSSTTVYYSRDCVRTTETDDGQSCSLDGKLTKNVFFLRYCLDVNKRITGTTIVSCESGGYCQYKDMEFGRMGSSVEEGKCLC